VDSLPDFTLAEDIEVQDLEEQKRKAMMGDAGSVASRAEVRGGEERSDERLLERSASKSITSPSCITN